MIAFVAGGHCRVSGFSPVEEPDPVDLSRQLRLSGERRVEEGESPGDEGPPVHYSITRSARIRIACGISSPRVRAVERFTTISYRIGSSMGRSAGFAPFRTLSTKEAARRNISFMF